MDKGKEQVQPCIICGKVWERKDAGDGDEGKWVYHESKGVVCMSHDGVKSWYKELCMREMPEYDFSKGAARGKYAKA